MYTSVWVVPHSHTRSRWEAERRRSGARASSARPPMGAMGAVMAVMGWARRRGEEGELRVHVARGRKGGRHERGWVGSRAGGERSGGVSEI